MHVMVVEDDEALGQLLKRLLETVGYAVRVETRGATALSYMAEHKVDLVMLDIGLPDMDGLALAGKLRQTYHPWILPIMMLTGRDKPIEQLRGYAYGADAYLTKPCEPEEILKTAALLLGEAAIS